jgi:hypothetical protein
MKIEKTKQRIKNIIKEVDPRNYPVSIREEKWEYYWTDNVSLANEMFNLVESLMTNEEHKEFSIWCLKATQEDMIDYIKEKLLKEEKLCTI